MTSIPAKKYLLFRRMLRGAFMSAAFCVLAASVWSQTILREGWKVQSSAQVKATGDKVSQPGFPTQAWYSTSAPKTVFFFFF